MVLSKLMPGNPKFAAKFTQAAQNAHQTAQALVELLENFSDIERKVQRIRDLEHEGDRLSREVTQLLAESFIVPFDREDIITLNHELDDLVDDLEDAATKLSLYKVQQPSPQMLQLAKVVEQQCALLAQKMPLIENGGKHSEMSALSEKIYELEDEGDRISDEMERHLYDGVTEVPAMIAAMRAGEIVRLMEDASDQAKRVAKIVSGILLKNA